MRVSFFVILTLSFLSSMFFASISFAADTPKEIVAKLYAPYLADPRAEKTPLPNSIKLIRPYATVALQKAIRADEECRERVQGLCNLDADIIINGQGWMLSDFMLTEKKPDHDRQTVQARFKNQTMNEVSYRFVQVNGQWKIDDIEAVSFDAKGKKDFAWTLRKALSP